MADVNRQIRKALEKMVALDEGMVNGRVLPAAERDAAYAKLVAETEAAFMAFAEAAPRRAVDLVEGLPVYMRPKRIDLARWLELATSVKPPPVQRIALVKLPRDLRVQLQALDNLAAAQPGQLVLEPPARDEDLQDAEEGLGVTLTRELRCLYRWCNGFSWRAKPGAKAVPVRMLPIHDVQRAGDLDNESSPRRRLNSVPKAAARVIEHPNRLQIFDVRDGSFVSVLCADDDTQALIDDHREGATTMSREPLATFLAYLLAPERVAADGRWLPAITDYF